MQTKAKQASTHRTAVRLGSFAVVLAGTFGTAYAIGERLPGHDHPTDKPTHDHPPGTNHDDETTVIP